MFIRLIGLLQTEACTIQCRDFFTDSLFNFVIRLAALASAGKVWLIMV
jgi:hypothetical protein